MDISHGHLLIPARALANDLAQGDSQLDFVTSAISVGQNVGRLVGYSIVSLDWPRLLLPRPAAAHDDGDGGNLQFVCCFLATIVLLWLAVSVTLFGTPSSTYQQRQEEEAEEEEEAVAKVRAVSGSGGGSGSPSSINMTLGRDRYYYHREFCVCVCVCVFVRINFFFTTYVYVMLGRYTTYIFWL